MRQILNQSNPRELNALFIQPTRWCGLNCKGCYVKRHAGGEKGFHTPWQEQLNLFKMYYHQQNYCYANQITISIDDLPSKTDREFMHMFQLFDGVLSTMGDLWSSIPKQETEVHMTFNSLDTLRGYLADPHKIAHSRLSMISFSNISKKDRGYFQIIKRNVPVNYNHLMPENITSRTIDAYVNHFLEIAPCVDSIYLVMFKRPIGKTQNELTKLGDKSRMKSDISLVNTLMKRLPENVRRKIHVDGCLQDTIKFKKSGFGCSSNVSRVQVWPDGSVSGCPYAFSGSTPSGRTAIDILENIAAVRKQYDFKEKCHLPDVYNSITD